MRQIHVSAESVLDRRDERIEQQGKLIEQRGGQIQLLESENARLKELLEKKAAAKAAKAAKTPNFSLARNKRNKPKKNTKKSTSKRGRKKQQAKLKRVTQEEKVFSEGVDPKECELRRSQFVWRIGDGKAIYVAYHIYDRPDAKELPLPPAVRVSRSEFGIAIPESMRFSAH